MLLTYILPAILLIGFGVFIWNGIIVPMWREADPNNIPTVRVITDDEIKKED